METPAITPQQRYRQSDKCKVARERYYLSKGKAKAHEYYERNKEVILNRSKERYNQIKLMNQENNLGNDLIA
jgi:predicted metal-dependent hydrolase